MREKCQITKGVKFFFWAKADDTEKMVEIHKKGRRDPKRRREGSGTKANPNLSTVRDAVLVLRDIAPKESIFHTSSTRRKLHKKKRASTGSRDRTNNHASQQSNPIDV